MQQYFRFARFLITVNVKFWGNLLFARQRALRLVQGQVKVVKNPAAGAKFVSLLVHPFCQKMVYNKIYVRHSYDQCSAQSLMPYCNLLVNHSILARAKQWMFSWLLLCGESPVPYVYYQYMRGSTCSVCVRYQCGACLPHATSMRFRKFSEGQRKGIK